MIDQDDLARERMRWMLDEAFRTLMRADGLVHHYYEQPAGDTQPHEASPVQQHVFTARHHLKEALEELGGRP